MNQRTTLSRRNGRRFERSQVATDQLHVAPRRRSAGAHRALGALLGLGAPLGFVALRFMLGRGRRHGGRERRIKPGSSELLALAYMGVATPIAFGLFGTMLGRREERLRAATEHIAQLREEFAAVVAHDLRSPIHAILLQLDLLQKGARDAQVMVPESTLQKLHRSGERLADMVNDLLDAARIEAAQLRLMPQAISLAEAVPALVERIRPTLGTHPIEVRVEGRPPVASVDPSRLDQIFTNLIENAAKYSEEGAPILVRVRAAPGGAEVSVVDRGPGIASQDLGRLFDRFYQSARAREKKSGLGLGLYITKHLVDAHGGRVEVNSELGKGSTFSVWFPSAEPS